jgi:hypothetical protein
MKKIILFTSFVFSLLGKMVLGATPQVTASNSVFVAPEPVASDDQAEDSSDSENFTDSDEED